MENGESVATSGGATLNNNGISSIIVQGSHIPLLTFNTFHVSEAITNSSAEHLTTGITNAIHSKKDRNEDRRPLKRDNKGYTELNQNTYMYTCIYVYVYIYTYIYIYIY